MKGVDLQSTIDAQVWAWEFLRLNPDCDLGESLMTTWFANALMVGWDQGRARLEQEQRDHAQPAALPTEEGPFSPQYYEEMRRIEQEFESPQPAELPDHECG